MDDEKETKFPNDFEYSVKLLRSMWKRKNDLLLEFIALQNNVKDIFWQKLGKH